MATIVSLRNVNKIYPSGVHAVHDFNIEIEQGEFIVMCGPSGCGKSTTLRMIAGLEEISSGDLIINGKRCNDLSPKDRDIAMVFQNYALYAHMTVYHNLAFSLTIRKMDSDEIHKRVMDAANKLGLVPYLNRKPKQLSGGQRQRVAVGRAIVRNPIVYLLDEPLSNLDAKLRASMRKDLAQLHHSLNKTFIYVTHDQIEALTLADRIVVMSMGHVQQIATPKEMFDNPENVFVAGFIGTPPMNFYHGYINDECKFVQFDGNVYQKLSDEDLDKVKDIIGKELPAVVQNDVLSFENVNITIPGLSEKLNGVNNFKVLVTKNGYVGKVTNTVVAPWEKYVDEVKPYVGKSIIMASRPDYVHMDEAALVEFKDAVLDLTVDYEEHLGAYNLIYGFINNERCTAKVSGRDVAKDPVIKICFDVKKVHFFDADTEARITGRK